MTLLEGYERYLLRGGVITLLLTIPMVLLSPLVSIPVFVMYYLIRAIMLAIMVSFTLLVFDLYRQEDIPSILFYLAVLVSLTTFYYLQLISFYLLNSGHPELGRIFYYTASIALIATPLPLLYFASSYTTNSINHLQGIPLYITIGMALQAMWEGDLAELEIGTFAGHQFEDMVLKPSGWFVAWFVSLMISAIFLIHRLRLLYDKQLNPEIRNHQITFMSAILVIFIVAPLMFLLNDLISSITLRLLWNKLVVNAILALGMSLLTIPYLNRRGINFLEPQPVIRLLIISPNGSLLFCYDFLERQMVSSEANDFLFSNAYTAINLLLKETSTEKPEIRTIELDNQFIYTRHDDVNTFLLFSKRTTLLIHQRFLHLINMVNQNHLKLIAEGSDAELKPVDQMRMIKLVEQAFGLVE